MEFYKVSIKNSILSSNKIVMSTLAFIIMTSTIISGYNIIRNFPEVVYALSSETEGGYMSIKANLAETNTTNVSAADINISDTTTLVPNQYLVVLKENATSYPHIVNNTISSLSNKWGDYGLNITSFPEVGMFTIDLNHTLAQEDKVRAATDASVADILDEIRKNPNVDYIEPNQIFEIK